MGRTRAGRAAIIATALLWSAACTSAPPAPSATVSGPTGTLPSAISSAPPLTDLRSESLPGGLQPSALLASDRTLLVGGQRGGPASRSPGLAEIAGGRVRQIPLTPIGPYAKVADLVALAVDGDTITAVGRAHGGAHSNPRWSTWQGTPSRVEEWPQSFETFGGEEAGTLVDVATTPAGPRIVGSWQGKTALDIAIWHPVGTTWMRLDSAGTPLANTATLQVSGRSAASTADGMIIAGSVLDLSDGVHQEAAVWRSTGDTDWTLIQLPEAGKRSEAQSATCTAGGCWIAGIVDDRFAAWRLHAGRAERVAALPNIPIELDGPSTRAVSVGAGAVFAVSSAGRIGVVSGGDGRWTTYAGPIGDLAAAAVVDGRIFLATRTSPDQGRLWSGEAP